MTGVRERRSESGSGWLVFAAVVMFVIGLQNITYGLAALEKDSYLEDRTLFLFQDLTFWAWVWISVGGAAILTGIGVLARVQAARVFGIALMAFNAIGQLAFLRAFPAWSFIIIALDVFVIYALTMYDYPTRAVVVEPYPAEAPASSYRGERAPVGAPTRGASGQSSGPAGTAPPPASGEQGFGQSGYGPPGYDQPGYDQPGYGGRGSSQQYPGGHRAPGTGTGGQPRGEQGYGGGMPTG
jgi:hypothetical protein